jgi:hypothetical protein
VIQVNVSSEPPIIADFLRPSACTAILDPPEATTMLLKHNQRRPVPDWLAQLNPAELGSANFALDEALQHSLYYPAAGFDGRPVQFLGGFIHSFIYVDYGMEEPAVDTEAQVSGFLGYHLAGHKRLSERELAPNGWHLQVPLQFQNQVRAFTERLAQGFVRKPFATWYIFDRNDDDRGEDHGPQRFSLIYICADGVAAYQALYWYNHTAPEVLAIIQPGTGFGGNYTDFSDPNGFLAWTVLRGNGSSIPEYLVCGGLSLGYTQAFWPDDYPEHIEWFQRMNGNGVWRRRV